ncbi:hypothetical protein GX51_03760 [Blastomyces parvus]|uniref:Uncharacterized protein n=1 Tax=Blastomyces parvus TaxID=2060905 RepID=A0A2B7WX18_9EURO|nr:hypothetical protein GX51_03760 [Blastomyces parvus]
MAENYAEYIEASHERVKRSRANNPERHLETEANRRKRNQETQKVFVFSIRTGKGKALEDDASPGPSGSQHLSAIDEEGSEDTFNQMADAPTPKSA